MERKEYYTVQEFADIVGTSRQSIYKVLTTKLSTYVTRINGVTMIHCGGLVVYDCQPDDNQGDSKNDRLYEILERELEAKNQMIENLRLELLEERKHNREQAERIVMLASQAQHLQLGQMIESKEIVDSSTEEPDTKKSSIWDRLFRK